LLTHIHIKNFTIVDSLSIDLQNGFTVLTGETGAGKSILLDAVAIALGARAETRMIRHGKNQCEITLCFDLTGLEEAKRWLEEQSFSVDDECIIRRVFAADGRSKNTMNDSPCSQSLVRQLGQMILNIYGQHEHQELMRPYAQQERLDIFASNEILLKKIQKLYEDYTKLNGELEAFQLKAKDKESQLEFLNYQYSELENLNLREGEWEELSELHQNLYRAKNSLEEANVALNILSENEEATVLILLQAAIDRLTKTFHPKLENAKSLLENASMQIAEAVNDLQSYLHSFDLSEEELERLDKKLSSMHDLSRKHQVSPDKLWQVAEKLSAEIEALNQVDLHVQKLGEEKNKLLDSYHLLADELTDRRKKGAKKLTHAVTEKIQGLGMQGAYFQVSLKSTEKEITAYGNEQVLFEVSTNPGQPMQLMQKIVSGGELSRIGLALQVITLSKMKMPTLIFDEVDTGIGGKTAETVGQMLAQLGKDNQVFCITHLPQVASCAHHHLCVEKKIEANETTADIHALNREERVKELARMSAGGKITQQILQHVEKTLS